MQKKFRVAFAGVHRQLKREPAGHNWAAGFAAVPEVEFAAVFDRGAETRQAFVEAWGPLPAYDDYGKMIEEIRPDIVCITTRQTMHADEVEEAARKGVRGILCEKPLATCMAEVDRIVRACERHGVKFAFGLDRRWYEFYRTLASQLRAGLIGDVQAVSAYGNSNLIFLGCHWFDRVLDLAGDPEVSWVSGYVDPLTGDPPDARRRLDPPGTCQMMLADNIRDGVRGYVTDAGSGVTLDVVGSRGRVVILNDGTQTRLWTLDDDGKTLVEREAPRPTPTDIWPAAVRDLLHAIETNSTTICDVACARRATEIGFAVHQSNREGGRRVRPDEIDRSLRVESYPWGNE